MLNEVHFKVEKPNMISQGQTVYFRIQDGVVIIIKDKQNSKSKKEVLLHTASVDSKCVQLLKKNCALLFRPLSRGEEQYTQMGFFVQSNLADRYIHRRELRLVSLESLSSGEYGIKKVF